MPTTVLTTVLDKGITTPPASPKTGDRYLVGSIASGAWSGHNDEIAEFNSASWIFTNANPASVAWVANENRFYRRGASSWDAQSRVGVISENAQIIHNVALPDDAFLEIWQGAALSIGQNQTLTIQSPEHVIASPRAHIFTGPGELRFSCGGDAHLPWTGAVGNGTTDDSDALQMLVNALASAGGRILLPFTPDGYLLSTTRTFTLQADLAIEGGPSAKVILSADICFTSAVRGKPPQLCVNATRGSQAIHVNALGDVIPGDIIWIDTNVDGETAWGYDKTDTHTVAKTETGVSYDTIHLDALLNFSYDTSDQALNITVYPPRRFGLRNLRVEYVGPDGRILVKGMRNASVEQCEFHSTTFNVNTQIELRSCVDTVVNHIVVHGARYGVLINFCRNTTISDMVGSHCNHPVTPATFSDGVLVRGLYGYRNAASVEAHPSFNVAYEDVTAYDTGQFNMRCLGATLRNARLYSSVASGAGASLVHSVALVYWPIYDDYDVHFDHVEVNYPNWKLGQNSKDVVAVYRGRCAAFHDCVIQSVAFGGQVAGKPGTVHVTESRIGRITSRNKLCVTNTRFYGGDFAAGQKWAHKPYSYSYVHEFTGCHFEGYEMVVRESASKDLPHKFVNCCFADIAATFMTPFCGTPPAPCYVNEPFHFHFDNCYFGNVAAFSSEVQNRNLRVSNCKGTNPLFLDCVTQAVASGSLAAGLANTIAFAWQNPHRHPILVTRVVAVIRTAGGTSGATMDVGVVASGTSTNNNLLDGIDINPGSVPVLYDSMNTGDAGTAGVLRAIRMDENAGASDYITGKIRTANASNLKGEYHIYYSRASG